MLTQRFTLCAYSDRLLVRGTLVVCALVPVLFLAWQVWLYARNIPNWDEFDVVLDFLIAIDDGASGSEIAQRLFAVQNEHRMLVSRSIFAASYWLFGGINFAVLAVIGNLFLAGTFGVLLSIVRVFSARLRLAAIFALAVFHLQHHENLFWSGASIDHFLVILLTIGALRVITLPGRWSLPVGCLLGFMGTFSLAHGILVWPIGAVLLWREGRRREIIAWSVAAALTLSWFFHGFFVNPGHRLPGFADLPRIVLNWLTILGGSPAFGNLAIAPWLGAVLFAITVASLWRSRTPGARVAFAVIVWCIGSIAMISWGRALISEGYPINSRYMVLSAIAWALSIWLLAERWIEEGWGEKRCLVPALIGLVAFNVAASVTNRDAGRAFARNREEAVLHFRVNGSFASYPKPLYPRAARADLLMREVKQRGIYRPPLPAMLSTNESREIGDALYFIDQAETRPAVVHVRGWAFRPEQPAKPGTISVLFRSQTGMFAFKATPRVRPDVAAAYHRSDAAYAGFELALPRDQLPSGRFQVGIGFLSGHTSSYMMTGHTLVVQNALDATKGPMPIIESATR